MIKDNLTVHPFSLKQIIENLDKIESKTGKFGEPTNQMSAREKKRLMELTRQFNEFGKALRADQAIMETAKNLSELTDLAKRYAMNESNSDFMQKETVTRDYKQMENITKQFQKMAQECVSHLMQMNALYEDAGNVLERYYEMENLNEMATTVEEPPVVEPDVMPGQKPAPAPTTTPTPRHPLEPDPGQAPRPKGMFNTQTECKACGCGKPCDVHGMPQPEEEEEYASGF
jgi:hypothetical protein